MQSSWCASSWAKLSAKARSGKGGFSGLRALIMRRA